MANNTNTRQVLQGLLAALATLTKANGYLNDFPASHIYPNFDINIINQKDDSFFPKMFVIIDDGTSTRLTGGDKKNNVNFVVIIIVKKIQENDDPQEMVQSYIEDMERLIDHNDSLGNTVQDASVTGFTTDSGYAYPEGVAIFRIETQRFFRANSS